MKRVTHREFSCHGLRHFFASYFILRWFAALYGRDAAAALGEVLSSVWFSEEALAGFRTLFVPRTWAPGASITTHPFTDLAMFMGHGGPEITVAVYVHTMDWLQRLANGREALAGAAGYPVESGTAADTLTIAEAGQALGLAKSAAHEMFRAWAHRGGVPIEEVLTRQEAALRLWLCPSQPAPPAPGAAAVPLA